MAALPKRRIIKEKKDKKEINIQSRARKEKNV